MSAAVPRHVAFIMDGNRRFSKRVMLKPWKGHEWGEQKLREVITWCHELGVQEVTVYALSVQNFERPQEEFDFLMQLFRESAKRIKAEREMYDKMNVRLVFIGRLHMLPDDVREAICEAMEVTKDNTGMRVNIAVAYGGREEVVDAVKQVAEQVAAGSLALDEINEKVFARSLYTDSEPDVVIRTGGEQRTSNFLIWQSHYAEWIFVEKLWPEFSHEDLVTCLAEFADRKRRFGK